MPFVPQLAMSWAPADTRVVLTGVSGTYVTTPDTPAISAPVNVDVMVCAALADWDPAANLDETFVGQWQVGQVAWKFWRGQSGFLEFSVSANGTTTDSVVTTTKVPASDGGAIWSRIRHTDAGDNDFFIAPYQEDEPATWISLTANRTTTAAAVFDSSAPVEVGASTAGTADLANGSIYRAIVKAGTTPILDMDPRDWVSGSSWVSSRTGETWTLNGAAVVQPKLQAAKAQVWGVRAA